MSVPVIVNNFMPYVQSVTIVHDPDNSLLYGATWPLTPVDNNTLSLSTPTDSIDPPIYNSNAQNLTLEIQFSQMMNTSFIPTVSFVLNNSPTPIPLTGVSSWASTSYPQTFVAIAQPGIIPTDYIGPVTIQINEAYDLAGNPINPLPQNIAVRNSSGLWVYNGNAPGPVPTPRDSTFVFQVSSGPRAYVQAVTVSQNLTPNQTPTPIYIGQWPSAPIPPPTITADDQGNPITILANGPSVIPQTPVINYGGAHVDTLVRM